MKTEKEITETRDKVDISSADDYPGMTYLEGIREALDWVLGEISDEDFKYPTR